MKVSVGVASYLPRGEDKVQSVSRVCQHIRCREADFSFDIISTLWATETVKLSLKY